MTDAEGTELLAKIGVAVLAAIILPTVDPEVEPKLDVEAVAVRRALTIIKEVDRAFEGGKVLADLFGRKP